MSSFFAKAFIDGAFLWLPHLKFLFVCLFLSATRPSRTGMGLSRAGIKITATELKPEKENRSRTVLYGGRQNACIIN